MTVTLSFLFPRDRQWSREFASAKAALALNGVCFGQLCTVRQEIFWNGVPGLAFVHPKINMCAGQVVDMELGVCVSSPFPRGLMICFTLKKTCEKRHNDGLV
jgi:hypothetical protein